METKEMTQEDRAERFGEQCAKIAGLVNDQLTEALKKAGVDIASENATRVVVVSMMSLCATLAVRSFGVDAGLRMLTSVLQDTIDAMEGMATMDPALIAKLREEVEVETQKGKTDETE